MRQSNDRKSEADKPISGGHGAGQSNLGRVDRRLIGADVRPHWGMVAVAVLMVLGFLASCRALDIMGSGGNNEYLIEGRTYSVVNTRTPTATPNAQAVDLGVTPSPGQPGALSIAATAAATSAPRVTIVPSATRYATKEP